MHLYAVRLGPYSAEGEMRLWVKNWSDVPRVYYNIGPAKAAVTILRKKGQDAHLVTFSCLEVPNVR